MKNNLIILLFFLCISNSFLFAQDKNLTTILIDTQSNLGTVNKKVFGNNIIADDPSTYNNWGKGYTGNTNFGAGIWDPVNKKTVTQVTNLAKQAGISVMRFPGGCGAHHYNWKSAIEKNRKDFLYGLDEFLYTCNEIGSEAVITVSDFHGDENDAADMVEYLNSSFKNNNAALWAKKRAEKGNKPYNIKYFEIGNETYHGDHKTTINIFPEDYAQKYLKYYFAMKKKDPSIKIGAVLKLSEDWNERVLRAIKHNVDFIIIHIYPSPWVIGNDLLSKINPNKIFSETFTDIYFTEYYMHDLQIKLTKYSGKILPVAVTEYNGGFTLNDPAPLRHTLGNALINAELLKMFINPENNILMANYWQFCNSYWGMIKSDKDFMDPKNSNSIKYSKRPNYFVYELYKEHFGNILIKHIQKINNETLFENNYFVQTDKNILSNKWENSFFQGVSVTDDDNILKFEIDNPWKKNYFHTKKYALVKSNTFYKLSGYIKAQNLKDPNGFCLSIQDGKGWVYNKSAAATGKVTGTTDWIKVETDYKTLPEANKVEVIVRRIGSNEPMTGTVYVKDVQLTEIKYNNHPAKLSINASKNEKSNTIYLIVINKDMENKIPALIMLQGLKYINSKAGVRILNGPEIISTNEKDADNIGLKYKSIKLKNNNLLYTFDPHSITAIEINNTNK